MVQGATVAGCGSSHGGAYRWLLPLLFCNFHRARMYQVWQCLHRTLPLPADIKHTTPIPWHYPPLLWCGPACLYWPTHIPFPATVVPTALLQLCLCGDGEGCWREGRVLMFPSVGTSQCPSCTICQVCLHSGLADMGLHHCRLTQTIT